MYAETARLASHLAKEGFTVASGGGPGIMEAAHLAPPLPEMRVSKMR
jgi:predicted Rossmann-fold nucleotide-binding protein